MRIAVVIPLFNAAPWIARAVRSVLDQDCPGVHVIVVDDGSTDNSLRALEPFEGKITVKSGPNRGACHARNVGLALADAAGAEFILFLDADDYLEGPMLAGSLSEAEAHGADLVLSNSHIELADGSRNLRPLYSGDVAPEHFFRGIFEGDFVNTSGLFWRVDLVKKVGGWNESLFRQQDFDISMRALLIKPRIRKNEIGAAIYTKVNPSSISKSLSERAVESRYRATAGLVDAVRGTSFETMLPLIYRELYVIARSAFREGYRDLGRKIVSHLAREGYTDHPGTIKHRVTASLIGLELKVRLWGV